MTIVDHIISKLGGVGAVAELAECSRDAVWRWRRPVGRSGGLGGDVPRVARRRMLSNAANAGVDLDESDFLPRPAGSSEAQRRAS